MKNLPSGPKALVAPTNGAVSSQNLVQTVAVKAQRILFSGATISVVHVIRIDKSELIAIFEAIDVTTNHVSLSDRDTLRDFILKLFVREIL